MDSHGVASGCLRPSHLRNASPRPHGGHKKFPSRQELEASLREPVKINDPLLPYVSSWLSETSALTPLELEDSHHGEDPETCEVLGECVASPTSNELTDSALMRSQALLEELSSLDLDSGKDEETSLDLEINPDLENLEEADSEGADFSFDDSIFSASTEDEDSVTVPKEMMKMMLEMWEELRALKRDESNVETKAAAMTSSASTASTRSQSSSSLPPRSRSTYSSISVSPLRTATPPATPRRVFARPCPVAVCSPASQVQVCIQNPAIMPHTSAMCQPFRSVSMVQTVTVSTSWIVS